MAISFTKCPKCGKNYRDDRKACPYCIPVGAPEQPSAPKPVKHDDPARMYVKMERIKAMAEKSLPIAIGLNFIFPGAGYFYIGRYDQGILAVLIMIAIIVMEPAILIFSAGMGINIIMGVDLLILHRKNKKLAEQLFTKKCPICAEIVQSEARKCRFCGADLPEAEAPVLPKGYTLDIWRRVATAGLGCVLLAAFAAVVWQGELRQPETARGMAENSLPIIPSEDQIHQEVINDSEKQYNIAKRQGTQMDACVQAGFVAAAYLQAKKEDGYRRWKNIEAYECSAAGVAR